jgi:hypothetical protein
MSEHKPRRGDKFYDQTRMPDQPNGFILDIDWEEKEVTVQFHDENKSWKHYSFDEIENYYDGASFGGGYFIYERVSELH